MTLEGTLTTRTVRVDGVELDPTPSQEVWNHSPDGFAWGYAGSGPAQLALAILLHHGINPEWAVQLHQRLKAALIQDLPQDDFRIEFDLDAWLRKHPLRP